MESIFSWPYEVPSYRDYTTSFKFVANDDSERALCLFKAKFNLALKRANYLQMEYLPETHRNHFA